MLGRTGFDKFKRFNKAYSLAEVLVVMAIIMLIFLALPPVTKKVFKITDTRKAHGRFECYWATVDNQKALYSYYSDENGTVEGPTKMSGNKCTFTPTSNTLYYMIHAVGGGGAGAMIATQKDSAGNITVDEDLTPKSRVQAVSYLAKAAVNAWPKWVTWFNKTNKCENIPWIGKDSTGSSYCPSKIVKNQFDVNSVSDMQQVRFRLGGSAGKVISSFVPQLPGSLTMEIYPGTGGKLSRAKETFGTGGDGGDTVIKYVYSGKEPIEAMRAAGGAGGSGRVDSRMSFTLVGGKPTDFLMSTKASIAKKLSGFIDVIESSEKYDAMKSHVPSDAGNGGSGETQFVANTAGQVWYEYDNNDGIFRYTRRYGSNWTNITNLLGTRYYTEDNVSTKAQCSAQQITSVVMERSGYCDLDEDATEKAKFNGDPEKEIYVCAVGDIPKSAIEDLSIYNKSKYPDVTGKSASSSSSDPTTPSDNNKVWQIFRVIRNTTSNTITGLYPMFPNTSLYDDGSVYNYYSDRNMYETGKTPYYSCSVNPDYLTIKCKTTMKGNIYSKTDKVSIHNCTKEDVSKMTCSNGEQAMCSKGTGYESCSDASRLKCPAHNGGDGAVVILW